MPNSKTVPTQPAFPGDLERPEDFFSPQQRVHAIAAILSEIAWRIATEDHDPE